MCLRTLVDGQCLTFVVLTLNSRAVPPGNEAVARALFAGGGLQNIRLILYGRELCRSFSFVFIFLSKAPSVTN